MSFSFMNVLQDLLSCPINGSLVLGGRVAQRQSASVSSEGMESTTALTEGIEKKHDIESHTE